MMGTFTPNFNLEKPAMGEQYSIEVFNNNADKMDKAAKAIHAHTISDVTALQTTLNSKVNTADLASLIAVGARANIVTGTYIGDGAASRTISLGFTPRAVILTMRNLAGEMSYQNVGSQIGIAVTDSPLTTVSAGNVAIVASGGFIAYQGGLSGGTPSANRSGYVYHYIAFN